MAKLAIILVGVLILSVFSIFCTADPGSPQEYLTEFSESNESCQIADAFIYEANEIQNTNFLGVTIISSNNTVTRIPTYYQCCNNSDCVPIIFDVNNRQLLPDDYLTELIDLTYIKARINSGDLSINQISPVGNDVCQYFGDDTLKQESINVAVKGVELAKPIMEAKDAYRVGQIIKTAKALNLVGDINPTEIIASVACKYDSTQLKKAVESTNMVNIYLKNIKNNYARRGYVDELNNNIETSKVKLKAYIDLPTAQIRYVANTAFNLISWFFNLLFSSTQAGNTNIPPIEKTEYDLAVDVYHSMSSYNLYLKHPQNSLILDEQKERIALKESEYARIHNTVVRNFNTIEISKPSEFDIIISNILNEPDYDLTEGLSYYDQAVELISQSDNQIGQYKYNSAIDSLTEAEKYLNLSSPIIYRENAVKRHFDGRLIIVVAILIGAFFLVKKYILDQTQAGTI